MAYSDKEKSKLIDSICLEIERGESVRSILKSEDTPDPTTFYKWIDEDEEKSKQYARACEARADLMFEDILHIADDSSKDTKTVDISGASVEVLDSEHVQRSKIRIDTRRWMLGKLQPKKYGDKLDLTTGGKSFEQPHIHLTLDGKTIDLSTPD